MQIEIRIEPGCGETRVIVVADHMSEEVGALVRRLGEQTPQMLVGARGDELTVLAPEDIVRIYAAGGKVYARTADGEYLLRLRLYELEERLSKREFVRISNSEIVNLKKVKGFDLSYTGTICVTMQNGDVTYVSRRYVGKIKQVLGI